MKTTRIVSHRGYEVREVDDGLELAFVEGTDTPIGAVADVKFVSDSLEISDWYVVDDVHVIASDGTRWWAWLDYGPEVCESREEAEKMVRNPA